MALLKKIKASTLMETLVANVLIVVVFMISSMILNNLFSNSIKNNTDDIDVYLNELEYLYKNEKILIPYQEEFKGWQIIIVKNRENQSNILFEAFNSNTNKSITKTIYEN
jgi:predicted PurR-regulated permease PerM